MKRILQSKDCVAKAKQMWQEYAPKIIKQAKLEGGIRIREKIALLSIDDEQDGM